MAGKASKRLKEIIDNPEIAIRDFTDLGDYLANEDINLFNTLMSNDKLSEEIYDYLDLKNNDNKASDEE